MAWPSESCHDSAHGSRGKNFRHIREITWKEKNLIIMLRTTRLSLLILHSVLLAGTAPASDEIKPRRLRAHDVFHEGEVVLFQDDFQSGRLDRWNFSENDQYNLPQPTPGRIDVVDAPGLAHGRKAVRMEVRRAPDSFRSEISLPYEKGFQERWYAQKLLIPEDWVFDPAKGDDIVMQWHGIPGNWRATFPNLSISIQNDRWFIKQSFGSAQTKPTRTAVKLDTPVQRGKWTSWVIHAKWSPREDGLLQIWQDGRLVMDRAGPNVYGTIGVDYTPYLKTGIYHPMWHLDDERKRAAFEKESPVSTKKIIYVTDVIIGDARMTLEKISSRP